MSRKFMFSEIVIKGNGSGNIQNDFITLKQCVNKKILSKGAEQLFQERTRFQS